MRRTISSHTLSVIVALSFSGLIASCGSETTQTQVDPPVEIKSTHKQLSEHLRATFENLVNESKTPNAQALKGTLSKVQGLLESTLGISLPSDIDVEGVTRVIEIVFESELVQEIFSEENVTVRNANQIIYALDTSLCDKLSQLVPSNNNTLVDSCRVLFEKNNLQFRVNSLENGAMDLELWHAPIERSSLAFVVSLNLDPNALGLKLDLDGAKDLLSAVVDLMADNPDESPLPIPGFSLDGLKKLSGALSVELRFMSEVAESGCANDERLCIVANVDRDLDIEVDMGKVLTLKLAKSPKNNPSINLSTGSNNSFLGAFNLGALLGSYDAYKLFLESSQFALTIPEVEEGADFEISIDNFKAGERPSYFEGFGKVITLDLLNEARTLESVNLAVNSAQASVDLTPLHLAVSMSDETVEQCLAYENLTLATGDDASTKLRFFMLPSSGDTFSSPYAAIHIDAAPACDESSLFLYMIWSMIGVYSENCEQPASLIVDEGSLELSYGYHLNDGEEQTLMLEAGVGQCLHI